MKITDLHTVEILATRRRQVTDALHYIDTFRGRDLRLRMNDDHTLPRSVSIKVAPVIRGELHSELIEIEAALRDLGVTINDGVDLAKGPSR